LCPLFGREKNTDGSGVRLTISLASGCYGDSGRKTFFAPELGLPTNLGWGDHGSFQLPQSNSSTEGA